MADSAGPAPVTASTGTPDSAAGGAATPSPEQVLPKVAQGSEPVQPAAASASTQLPGEPPKERWPDILDNARKKTRAEVDAEYRHRYSAYDAFEKDPWSAVRGWLDEASTHSVYGPLVSSYLTERSKPQRPTLQEPTPDVPIVDEQGHITGHTYSAEKLREWREWNNAELTGKLEARFGPIEQRESARAEREAQQEIHEQAEHFASTTLAELRQQPYFREHEADIKQALLDNPNWGSNVHAAYTYVLTTKILPQLSRAEQGKVVEALTGKASGTTVAPSGQTGAAPKFTSFREAAKYYAQHPEEAQTMAQR